jgi:hypothetical protein
MLRTIASIAALVVLSACGPSSAGAPIAEQWRAVEVNAAPISFPREQIGRLRFRGGLELTSPDAVFGGLSGLEVLDGERLLIMNDDAEWFDTHLVLDEEGALIGLDQVRYAMMRDGNGQPYHGHAGDTEGLAQLLDGRFAVSFEQSQNIRIFDLNRDGPFGESVAGPRLAETRRLPSNAGLEALTITANGDLLVGAEGGLRATTPLWRVPLDAGEPVAPLTGYPPRRGYSLTGLDRLPDGGFVALERFYAPIIGPRARITRFAEDALVEGERVSGVEELANLTPPLPLDNFEGIAAARMRDGATRIYIVSDDNYSPRQRTLLLAFDIVEDEGGARAD